MKKKYLITIGIIFLMGFVIALGETWSNTNKTLNIVCQPNQIIFNCDCAPEPKMDYYVTATWEDKGILYVNYTGKMWMGTCVQGKKETTITYKDKYDDEIQNDLMSWLTTEYNKQTIKTIKTISNNGGTIHVIP